MLTCHAVVVQGQDAQIARIRQLYAEAKSIAEKRKEAELPPDETVITSDYMAPGAGPIKDVTHIFYSGDFDDNLGRVNYVPYLMTRKYNVGAREYYEEYLFDKERLVFFFCKLQDDETRYYWGEADYFHEAVKGERLVEEAFARREAEGLKGAFDKLMNKEY